MKLLEALPPDGKDRGLALSLDPQRIPAHIAIIMDGNGRWAKRRGLPRFAGHRAGVQMVRSVVEDCSRLGVHALTLYAFSAENWKRPRPEVDMLWRLLRFYLRHELEDLHTGMCLNLAINYSSRNELVDAVNALVDQARIEGRLDSLVVDEEMISKRLYTAGLPEPDLLIRTSGEMRISNFLLWQIAYAELYVTDTLWPDFNREELLRAILEFQRRERRFGGIAETVTEPADLTVAADFPDEETEEIAVSSQ